MHSDFFHRYQAATLCKLASSSWLLLIQINKTNTYSEMMMNDRLLENTLQSSYNRVQISQWKWFYGFHYVKSVSTYIEVTTRRWIWRFGAAGRPNTKSYSYTQHQYDVKSFNCTAWAVCYVHRQHHYSMEKLKLSLKVQMMKENRFFRSLLSISWISKDARCFITFSIRSPIPFINAALG
jgi:hypothetical protein